MPLHRPTDPDIVEKLRAYVGTLFSSPAVDELVTEAADEIERLRSIVKKQIY